MMSAQMPKNPDSPSPADAENVVGIVDELLDRAVTAGASDIHFEPTGSELKVKFRLDGVLNPLEDLPAVVADNVIARLKVLGGLLTYRNDIPQEGRLEISKDGSDKVTDVRLAVFPTIYGQRAVVRLFYRQEDLLALDRLGFAPQVGTLLKIHLHTDRAEAVLEQARELGPIADQSVEDMGEGKISRLTFG